MTTPPTKDDVLRGLFVAVRLFAGRADAYQVVDATVDGFWKSLFAAAVALPPFIATYALRESGRIDEDLPLGLVAVLLHYAVGWLAYPVAVHHLTGAMGRRDRFLRYIVAYNWSLVVQATLLFASRLIVATGVLPNMVVQVVQMTLLAAIIYYLWFMARHGLQIGGAAAGLVVVLDILLSLTIDIVGDRLAGG